MKINRNSGKKYGTEIYFGTQSANAYNCNPIYGVGGNFATDIIGVAGLAVFTVSLTGSGARFDDLRGFVYSIF